ncbi:2Fe-2S iron-sulfur cluster-binding protein [Thermomicrobium roseum]|uniref:Xylene monooxygenase electron transfer subunit n=1 Tax=Thermomicrobium roseum (strain ATCC 27502 / DSM 5159 / P-2) TaxID=309801 RepID=B9L560_THERP|nr:2Fe-2S iron-sulfur cluster binding domain-containing protein [Thermomicrobium roseum]ACM06651.1 xylene monooxygenase electron transfer subunit [Thermomicrobium roseum DSM 5159]
MTVRRFLSTASRSTLVVGPYRIPVADGETLLDALRRSGLWVPYECGWGSCGTCKAQLLSGEIRYRSRPSCLRPHDHRLHRIALCVAEAVSDEIAVKPLRVSHEPQPHLATLDAVATLTDRYWLADDLFELTLSLDRPVDYRPGQYAILELGGARRCYSMLDPAPTEGARCLRFLLRVLPGGALTPQLAELPMGSELPVQVPYGGAYLRPARSYLFVAGGTGIAPILAIVRALSPTERKQARLLYGAATPRHLAYLDELRMLLGHQNVIVSVDRPTGSWRERVGPITLALPGILSETDREHVRCYLAGPPGMLAAAEEQIRAAGIEANRIHVDAFA